MHCNVECEWVFFCVHSCVLTTFLWIYVSIVKKMYKHISLGTLVPNIRDRQGKLWLPNVLESNLTITCPSNTGHTSLTTKLLAPWIYSSSLSKLCNSLNWNCRITKFFVSLTHSLPAHTDRPMYHLNYRAYNLHSFPGQWLFLSIRTFLFLWCYSLS